MLKGKLEEILSKCKIQIPDQIVLTTVLYQNNQNLLNIELFDSFPHLEELILEEQDQILLKNINSLKDIKLNKLLHSKSVYNGYVWYVIKTKSYIFWNFVEDNISELSLLRYIKSLNKCLKKCKITKEISVEKMDYIKKYFSVLAKKYKFIRKIEKEQFEETEDQMVIKIRKESINEDDDGDVKAELIKKVDSQIGSVEDERF